MKISPKNWTEFQHYKNRRPPWIKLYRTLLDDVEFHCLPDASKALAIMLWLLASEHESGSINAEPKALAFRLRTTPVKIKDALKPLIDGGFFVASTLIADCLHDAIPETETETETETYKPETEVAPLPDWIPVEAWNGFCEMRRKSKSAFTERAKVLLIGQLLELRNSGQDVGKVLDQSTSNGWKSVYPLKANGGNGNGKFNPNAYIRKKLTESLGRGALQEVQPDIHGEVQSLLSGPRND